MQRLPNPAVRSYFWQILWLPLLVQIVGTEYGTPDLMDKMISVLECDIHDSDAIVARQM
jgi:hypothetical protein